MIVRSLDAFEILDSRGIPTLQAQLMLENGVQIAASVPSGKSTGKHEACELRDGDQGRHGGKGVLRAVEAVRALGTKLEGQALPPQRELDRWLIEQDGTPNKTRLGANALLGVSIAAARARAMAEGIPLYEALDTAERPTLPVPSFNVLNGGAHADNALDFQEFMIMPAGLPNFREALRAGAEVYHALAHLLESKHLSVSVGDEGGFAPQIRRPEEALDLLMEATERAGYRPGEDVFFSLDPAANGFFHPTLYGGGGYQFDDRKLDPEGMVALYEGWLGRYPILSIEDGLAEEDTRGWRALSQRLRDRVQLVGDDIFVSNPTRVKAAIADGIGNAVLLKPNQIGTVSEILETARVARQGGFRQMVSHRSGETTDDFIADLAVALACGQIKSGAPARGERVAKYNRLLWIERRLGPRAVYAGRETFAVAGAGHP